MFKQLESVNISHCKMDAGMVVRVIKELRTFIRNMKEVTLQGVSWNTEEVRRALAQFIADAPKLEKCDIFDKTSHPRIVFERQKASQEDLGFVKIIDLETNQPKCEVKTTLSTEIRLVG